MIFRRMLLLPALVIGIAFDVRGQSVTPQLTVNPTTIRSGERATLTWRVPGASGVYILGLGDEKPAGSLQVSPTSDTTYTLVTNEDPGARIPSVTLRVLGGGARGDDSCPPTASTFGHERRYTVSGLATVQFLSTLHRVLQNELEFYTTESQTPPMAPHFVFSTSCSVWANLVTPEERRQIGERRVAFIVEVSAMDGAASGGSSAHTVPSSITYYSVKTFIQYRRKIESTWRTEEDDTVHAKAANALQSALGRNP